MYIDVARFMFLVAANAGVHACDSYPRLDTAKHEYDHSTLYGSPASLQRRFKKRAASPPFEHTV